MISIIFLITPGTAKTEVLNEAPDLLERDGVLFSLRAGPRQPQATDRVWDPVAVYAPDDLTEEEFQDLFEVHRKRVPELALKY
jgi:hypothetical protein